MYKDISKVPDIHNRTSRQIFMKSKKRMFTDKMKENEIAASMKISNRIVDETSKIVKQQYEENPILAGNHILA